MTYFKFCPVCDIKTEHEDDDYENGVVVTCVRCDTNKFVQTKEQLKTEFDYMMSLLDIDYIDDEERLDEWEYYQTANEDYLEDSND